MSVRRLTLPLLCALAGCSAPPPAPATPSVLVSTQPVTRGEAPVTVQAYGSAAPALDGSQTLSIAQPGQVIRLAATPGLAVRAGQPLITVMTAPAARSAYQQALAALTAARKQQETTARLLAQQLATADQMAQAEKAVADAGSALAALRADGAGQAQQTLSAAFDGVVTAVSVAQGDRIQAGAPLLTVARTRDLVATVGVDPADQARLRKGQAAVLERLSGGGQINGQVLRVASALDAKTRLVGVDLSFPAGSLMPGEAVRAAITVGRAAGWIVPHRAVVTADGPPHVFQAAGGKARAVPVRLALSSPGGDVVQGELDPSKPLIVDGAYQVVDGVAVRSGR